MIRTAYLPEGTGTIDHRSRMALVGLARRLVGDPLAEDGSQWTVGVAYRSFSAKTTDNRTDPLVTFDDRTAAGTWDVGTTLCYRFNDPAHEASLAAAVAWQNVTDATLIIADRKLELPRVIRMGLTAAMTFRDARREWAHVVAAVSRMEYAAAIYDEGTNQMGVEVTALRLLALRVGSNDRFHGGSSSWGIGLVLDHPRGMPLEMAVDYGRIARDDELFNDADLPMWSGRVRMDF